MKGLTLREILFLTICCDLGLFSKRIISPFVNVITDSLHIPGGIGTSFSLMFLVVAATIIQKKGCATLMSIVQSVIALSLGMVGSMGALSPIGYVVPGIMIDCVLYITNKLNMSDDLRMLLANMLGGCSASCIANILVFHLFGTVFALYISVGLLSGAMCGILANVLSSRILPIVKYNSKGVNV